MADQSEKTEEPTPKRRREAREKGQVLKSKEVNLAALLFVVGYSLSWLGPYMFERLFHYFQKTYSELWMTEVTVVNAYIILAQGTVTFILIMLPMLAAVYFIAALMEFLQVGVLITGKPLKPQMERINPFKGFKRIFSLKSLVELVKGIIKTIIIGWIVFTTIRDNVPFILMLVEQPPPLALKLGGEMVLAIAKKVALTMLAIAGIDYFYQRWEFEKSLRMSKQEVKDEWKQTEGDPHIKGKQRQKMRQMARGGVQRAVPDASAVVTNPTHYAVAIKFELGMEAPVVLAKGEGALALYIKELAAKHDIPMFEDVQLARALFAVCEVDEPIPNEFYVAVAQIIAQILKKKQKSQSPSPGYRPPFKLAPAPPPPGLLGPDQK